MNTSIQIIPATLENIEEIIALGALLSQEEQAYEPHLTYNREESLEHYKSELTNPNALLIAAVLDDGTITGYHYSYTEILDYLSTQNNQCTLEALYVLPEYRGSGIGRLLTDKSQDWAINIQKVDRIIAHIYSNNEASTKLHEKRGFKAYNTEFIKYV